MRRIFLSIPCFLLLLVGCGSSDRERLVKACRAATPSIQQGVFGCVTSVDDTGPPSPEPVANFAVRVFAAGTRPDQDDDRPPLASTVSTEIGYFELPLKEGDYWICTSFYRCRELRIPANTVVRRGYEIGIGSGW